MHRIKPVLARSGYNRYSRAMGTRKIVVKFGGSNLRNSADIGKVVNIARSYGRSLVIVVSAFHGITNSLAAFVRRSGELTNEADTREFASNIRTFNRDLVNSCLSDPSERETVHTEVSSRLDRLERFLLGIHYLGDVPDFVNDAVLSYGERLSSLILAAALREAGVTCSEVLPEELGLLTDGEYGNATCDFAACESRVAKRLGGDTTFVVPGFYGVGPDGKSTLFGRGGSDYSAAAIARCIMAESLDVWKDVSGFLSADPNTVANPWHIHRLSYLEAAELSYFGAKILHPRTVEPLFDRNIPIRILNVDRTPLTLEPGTIIDESRNVSDFVVKAVSSTDDVGVLKLHGPGVGFRRGILAKATGTLDARGINIKSVITAQTAIDLLVSRNDLPRAYAAIHDHLVTGVVDVTMNDDVAIVAVVGDGILQDMGGGYAIASRALHAASAGGVHVLVASAGASEVALYLLVRRQDRLHAVSLIHEEFLGR